jgi:hypothetical protein
MKHRLPCLRRHRPARGQLLFIWVTTWLPLEPPRPTPLPAFWWRKSRKSTQRPPERSEDRDDRTIDRWVKRRATCLLCGGWPAPCGRWIQGRLIVLCRECDVRPNATVRANEIITQEWRELPDEWEPRGQAE